MNTTKPYRVRGIDLDHDGKRYPEGGQIDLDDEAAARLKRFLEPIDDGGAAEKAAAEKAAAEKAAAEKAEAEKAAAEKAEAEKAEAEKAEAEKSSSKGGKK